MVLQLPCLTLEVALNGYNILLVEVASFLIITDVIGCDSDVVGAPLLPLLAILGALPSALDGGFGLWCSTATSGCFRVAQDEGSTDCLLATGVPCGNIEQLFDGFLLIKAELMPMSATLGSSWHF
jgi:hypothetical protein